jgi:transcriptional regulator with XRE-family HTH domain
VSHIERAQIPNPTLDVIEALATALGVRPDYLLGWTDDPLGEDRPASVGEGRIVYQVAPGQYRQVQELLDLFTELGPEDQRILMDLAQRLRRAGDVRIIGDT